MDLIRSDTFGDVDAYIKEKEVAQGSKSTTTRASRVKKESNSTRYCRRPRLFTRL